MLQALDRVVATIVAQETPGLGERRWRRCLERSAGDACAALDLPVAGAEARRRWRDPSVRAAARERARRFLDEGGRLLLCGDDGFPPRMSALDWTPPVLYLRGAVDLPERAVTIVGTRRALPSARSIAADLAAAAARAGIAVVSGLALGIDAAAHRGALAGGGPTIAVLGTGVDRCYPRAHRRLMQRVAASGLLVSELPPGTMPRAYHFPSRNRILAALADAVVVVQAPEGSGALITADHALEAGVELLAVPGDPLLPENAGSNRLIADGARLVLDANDVMAAVTGATLPAARPDSPRPVPAAVGRVGARLLGGLDLAPHSLEALAHDLELEIAAALRAAVELELLGLVESLPGGRLRLTPLGAGCDRRRTGDAGRGV